MNLTTSQKGVEIAIHEGHIYRRGGKIKKECRGVAMKPIVKEN